MARPAIWLALRMTANEYTAMSEGNITYSVEGSLTTSFAASHRSHSTFITDDMILLSLRGPLVTASNRPTSVDVRYSLGTSDGINATVLKDPTPEPPTPIPARIDSHERTWQIEQILRRRRARGSRRRGKQYLVE